MKIHNLTTEEIEAHVAEIRGRWSKAVGSFVLSFGEIEWATYYALAEIPSDDIFESCVSLPFGKRVDLLLNVLRGRDDSYQSAGCLVELLEQAKALSVVRNLLAHNPQRMSLYADEESRITAIIEEVTHHRNEDRSLAYEEVVAYAEAAGVLERNLWSAVHNFVKASASSAV